MRHISYVSIPLSLEGMMRGIMLVLADRKGGKVLEGSGAQRLGEFDPVKDHALHEEFPCGGIIWSVPGESFVFYTQIEPGILDAGGHIHRLS